MYIGAALNQILPQLNVLTGKMVLAPLSPLCLSVCRQTTVFQMDAME